MKLSPKEQECYNHAIKLISNLEIAYEMKITEKTVKYHLTNIFKKCEVKNKIELVKKLNLIKPLTKGIKNAQINS